MDWAERIERSKQRYKEPQKVSRAQNTRQDLDPHFLANAFRAAKARPGGQSAYQMLKEVDVWTLN
jgi:hypothetical protein